MTWMDFYRLPDGRVVPVDRSAAKGARVIDFTLRRGVVVKAERVALVPAAETLRATVLAWAAINAAATHREALLLLAEDHASEPEVVAAAQRMVAEARAEAFS